MSSTLICPYCGSDKHQVKNGAAPDGVPRFKCQDCKHSYALVKKTRGYDAQMRLKAVQIYLDGIGFRRAGRLLGVNHQSVANWVREYHERVKEKVAGFPHESKEGSALSTKGRDTRTKKVSLDVVEGDELFTFVKEKK